MKFISAKTLKRIEKENKGASGKALLKSMIIATTVASVLIVVAPMMKENSLFIALAFAAVTFFGTYTTSMYEVDLLRKSGNSEEEAIDELSK